LVSYDSCVLKLLGGSTLSTVTSEQAVATGTWRADPVHSEVGFSVDYMAGTFRGTFSQFAVALDDGRLEGTVDVSSVQVKDPNLEAHLQTPDFFDAERHPKLRFASKEIERDRHRVTIEGQITIKGETRPIRLEGTVADPIADPYGNERFGLRLTGEVDRTQFGVSWNNPLPSGEPALANRVELVAELQLVKAA
jgi:polyisoprenoid-binding protein YceI